MGTTATRFIQVDLDFNGCRDKRGKIVKLNDSVYGLCSCG